MRDVSNRYQGLPQRSTTMLFQIVRKFTRGAVNHYPFIQEKKQQVRKARDNMLATGEREPLEQALEVLFLEFHFYLTCWLQIDLALYRLASGEAGERFGPIREAFAPVLERHMHVRALVDEPKRCVEEQFARCQPEMECVTADSYWFGDVTFTVDESSLKSLHSLYDAIMANRREI